MSPGRLIRLVPTGEVSCGIEVVEPVEVQPLTEEQVLAIVREAARGSAIRRDGSTSVRIARAIEQAHGIGRRLDA